MARQRLREDSGVSIHACGAGGFVLTQRDICGKTAVTTRLAGAHRTMKNYVWNPRARHRPHSTLKRQQQKQSMKRAGPLVFNDGRAYHGATAGLERGKHVHAQLEAYATLPWRRFKAMYPRVDPLTKAALNHIRNEMHLVPIDSEYLVFDKMSGVGTAVDLVCLKKKGPPALVFVEIKTGYSLGTFVNPSGKFQATSPLAKCDDTPLNRARTQLLLADALFRYGDADSCRQTKIPPLGLVVVQVEDTRGVAETVHARSFNMSNISPSKQLLEHIRKQRVNYKTI